MELKHCPFCGSQNENVNVDTNDTFYWVHCEMCGTIGPKKAVEFDAIEAWNHRAEPPNDPLTLEELRKMEGEPVWCDLSMCEPVSHMSQWAIVRENESEVLLANGGFLPFVFYGRTWIAYRRKPEGEHKHSESLLASISTRDLVCELQAREGVEAHTAEPYQDVTVSVNGPAVVLVVID